MQRKHNDKPVKTTANEAETTTIELGDMLQ